MNKLFPFYWKHNSGNMPKLVKKFFSDSLLSEIELFQVKAYIWQWVYASLRKPNSWDERLASCKTKAQLMDYVRNFLLPNGIDPF